MHFCVKLIQKYTDKATQYRVHIEEDSSAILNVILRSLSVIYGSVY